MCPQSGQAGASPIMSPSTSWTVATEFSVFSKAIGSACCTGVGDDGFSSTAIGSACCTGVGDDGFSSTAIGSACFLSLVEPEQYLFYLNTQDQGL